MRPTDSQQVVATSLISSACNKLMTTACIATCYERPVLLLLEEVSYCHQPCNTVITYCSRLVTTTGNKHAVRNILHDNGLTATLLQLVCRSVTTCVFTCAAHVILELILEKTSLQKSQKAIFHPLKINIFAMYYCLTL